MPCTQKLSDVLQEETIRFLQLALYQGRSVKTTAALTIVISMSIVACFLLIPASLKEMQVSDNPGLQQSRPDPTLFCTATKKNRFYMLTQREPEEVSKTCVFSIFCNSVDML